MSVPDPSGGPAYSHQAPPSYSFVVCKSTGEDVDEARAAKTRSITRTLNRPTSATVRVPLGDDLAPWLVPGEGRLKVFRSPTPAEISADPAASRELVFYGSLPAENTTASADEDWIQGIYRDPRWVLERRYLQRDIPPIAFHRDQGQLVELLLSEQLVAYFDLAKPTYVGIGELWFRIGSKITGVIRDRSYVQGQKVSDIIDDMTKVIDGCDFDFQPIDYYATGGYGPSAGVGNGLRMMGLVNAYAQQGSDKPNAVFGYGPGTIANIAKASLVYQPVTTKATITGAVAGGVVPVKGVANNVDPNAYLTGGLDLLENWAADPDLTIQATVDEKANGIVNEMGHLRPVVTIADPLPDAPQPFVDYDIGDTVYVDVRRGALSYTGALRVMSYTLTVGPNGEHTTSPLVLA